MRLRMFLPLAYSIKTFVGEQGSQLFPVYSLKILQILEDFALMGYNSLCFFLQFEVRMLSPEWQ